MAELTFTRLGGRADASDLLVVGPSLGTSVETLWGRCAVLLGDRFEVVGWDLPGHGRSKPARSRFSIAELADAVREQADGLVGARAAWYAGVSLAGTVAFQLGLDPGPFRGVVAVASAPRIGDAESWQERAALVRRAGTPIMVEGSAVRWFAPGFIDRHPETAGRMLTELSGIDSQSYAWACDALAEFDVRPRLADLKVPLLVVAGAQDQVLAPEVVPGASLEVLERCGHLPPAENPDAVAALLQRFFEVPDE
jgi:pimeloyl-ACP methyl ester carboxylesterase